MAIDPVCHMEVEESSAAATSEYKGQKYYFCAAGCKRAFDQDPEKYLASAQGSARREMPSLKAFFSNMTAPMPLRRKVYLLARNNWTKLVKRQTCCGHPGEPGC